MNFKRHKPHKRPLHLISSFDRLYVGGERREAKLQVRRELDVALMEREEMICSECREPLGYCMGDCEKGMNFQNPSPEYWERNRDT